MRGLMKVVIDKNLCINCGACASIDEEVFQFDINKGEIKIISQPKKMTENLKSAIEGCPVLAIKTEE